MKETENDLKILLDKYGFFNNDKKEKLIIIIFLTIIMKNY